ncbi:MAG: C39 family peptidase [Pseudomonadota bacterium]
MQTLRFADVETVPQYPLEIPDALNWQGTDGGWRVDIPLPDLEAGALLTPSLSLPTSGPGASYRFVLMAGEREYRLPTIPTTAHRKESGDGSDRRVRTALDCFLIEQAVQDVHLQCTVSAAAEPARYLLTVSCRPRELSGPIPEPATHPVAPRPAEISQMLANPRIANRICSPVSTAMVIAGPGVSTEAGRVVRDCFDPLTGMYGLWPLAIRSAALQGYLGAVELLSGWTDVEASLEAALPVIASIRFDADALPGSPQRKTAGHLVVVYGIEGDEVLVCDPAAPNHGSVSRRYPAAAFAEAWFRHRGAAYMLTPCAT